MFQNGRCRQLDYPDCVQLQKDNLAPGAIQLSSYSGEGLGYMSWLPARLGRPQSGDAKHPNGSGRSQSRPMQAYPLRLSSVLKLRGLALKQYHQEHRARSGSGMCQS